MKEKVDIEVCVIREGRFYSCYIKDYDMYFSSPNRRGIDARADAMIRSWYDFEHNINVSVSNMDIIWIMSERAWKANVSVA